MDYSNILLNVVTVIALISRFIYLNTGIKEKNKGKIKFEIFLIMLIIFIWSLFNFKVL